jgi:phosphoribosyl 1,2-cyclic phosphodiesterase
VEVRLPGDELIILDAGTGIRGLGERLVGSGKPVHATLAITHPHWDHIQGFPFFRPLFLRESIIRIIGPESERYAIRQVLSDLMNKTYFPVKLDEILASLSFSVLNDGALEVPGATIKAIPVNHPSFTVGYRVESNGKSIVYISDNEPFAAETPLSAAGIDQDVFHLYSRRSGDPNEHIYDFARGADVLIHDSTYTPEEYVHHRGWGHSPYVFAVKVAQEASVRTLVLFHHDHTHTDEKVDEILNQCRRILSERGNGPECVAAHEGMTIGL